MKITTKNKRTLNGTLLRGGGGILSLTLDFSNPRKKKREKRLPKLVAFLSSKITLEDVKSSKDHGRGSSLITKIARFIGWYS